MSEPEPRTKIWVIQEYTIQPTPFEPIKIGLTVQYSFEPFANAKELNALFESATPVIKEQIIKQFNEAFEIQKQLKLMAMQKCEKEGY